MTSDGDPEREDAEPVRKQWDARLLAVCLLSTFLGIFATIGLYFILCDIWRQAGRDACSAMAMGFIVFGPISIGVGGFLSGLVAAAGAPEPLRPRTLLLICPGLYLSACFLIAGLLVPGAALFAVSYLGVWLGSKGGALIRMAVTK